MDRIMNILFFSAFHLLILAASSNGNEVVYDKTDFEPLNRKMLTSNVDVTNSLDANFLMECDGRNFQFSRGYETHCNLI